VKVRRVILVGVFVVLCGSVLKGATVYVDAAGPNEPGTGTATDPFRQIQDGIDAAEPNDVVEIRPGVYTGAGNYDLDPKGKSITIQGVSPFEPSVAAATIIDANGAGRGFYVHSGEDANCVIQGLTIRNGRASGSGAAICCEQTSPTVNNCVISSCFSVYGGGAILCWDSNSTISNCILFDNSTSAKGGGIWLISADVTVSNCTISGNSATQYGGAIHCSESTLELSNSILRANIAGDGNEIALSTSNSDQNSIATVRYCDVEGGQQQIMAGANCTIYWNTGNIDEEPFFAVFDANGDANMWDFHLQSGFGRWDANSEGWVNDFNTSGCIDAGDPNTGWASEPWPNGRRINTGAYGGTIEASKNGNEADFDVDMVVDFRDFVYLAGKWGIEEYCIEDLSGDGVVDVMDLGGFAGNWLWHK